MVFESFVADLLNRYLSQYIENINESQLKIGIWGGDVVLKKLVLKAGTLDELDLPVRTTYGQIGTLVLKIPWKNLQSAPLTVLVERLFLLAVPNQDLKYDAEKEEKWQQEAKQKILHEVENVKKVKLMAANILPEDKTLSERLITQIIRNIQIKINEVHIRYEDKVTNVDRPFALGITLAYFYIYTTNSNWEETVILDDVQTVNKVVDMSSLAVYWNCNTHHFPDIRLNEAKLPLFLQEFQNTISTKDFIPLTFHYMLGPINGSVYLIMNLKPELDNYCIPKFDFNVKFDELTVHINKFQYHDLLKLIDSLKFMDKAAPYRKYRPNLETYRQDYKVWWKFAYTCILEEKIRRKRNDWNWEKIFQHRNRCRRYAQVYRSKMISKKGSRKLDLEIADLEKSLDVFNIILIREQVEMEVEKYVVMEQPQSTGGRWYDRFWNRSSDSEEETQILRTVSDGTLTQKQKVKLQEVIGSPGRYIPDNVPKSYVSLRMHFQMDIFQIQISDGEILTSEVLKLKLTETNIELLKRPTVSGLEIRASILRLDVYGTPQKNYFPNLIKSKNIAIDTHLLEILVEINPLDQQCDQRLHIFLRPLEIVYDAETTQNLFDVFRTPGHSSLHKLQAHLYNVKEMSSTGLQYAIEKHPSIELKLDIKSPYIIIPRSGIYTHNRDVLVFNLGNLTMSSFPRDTANINVQTLFNMGISEHNIKKTMISQTYDKFTIHLEDVQVLFAFRDENWREILNDTLLTPLHLLEPMHLTIVFNNCLIRDDPRFPKMIFTGSLPKVAINFASDRLLHLFLLLSSIPSIVDDEEEIQLTDHQVPSDIILQLLYPTKKELNSKGDGGEAPCEEENKIQAIEIDVTFELEMLTVNVHEVKSGHISKQTTSFNWLKEVMQLHLINLELELVCHTFETDVVFRMQGISLNFCDRGGIVKLIDTPMTSPAKKEDYLLTVNYVQVDQNSPELYSKHDSILQCIQVHFRTMIVLLQQEVLTLAGNMVHTFMRDLRKTKNLVRKEEENQAPLYNFKTQFLKNLQERQGSVIVQSKVSKFGMKRHQTRFRLQADFQKLQITFATRSKEIAEITIEGCQVKASIVKKHTSAIVSLRTLNVVDSTPECLHRAVFSILDDEFFSLEFVSNSWEKLFAINKTEQPDMTITAKISRIRIIYLHRVMSALLTLLKSFQPNNHDVNSINSIGSENSEVHQNVIDPYYLKVTIDICALIFILPQNSKSLDAIVIEFHYLKVSNQHHAITSLKNKTGNSAEVVTFQINLQNLKIAGVTLTRNYELQSETVFLQPISFIIYVEHNLSTSWHKTLPMYSIDLRLQRMNIILTQEDCKTVKTIMHENFNEDQYKPQARRRTTIFGFSGLEQDKNFLRPTTKIEVQSGLITYEFSVLMDGIDFDMVKGDQKKRKKNSEGYHLLADRSRFTFEQLTLRCFVLSEGKTKMTIKIVDFFCDDISQKGKKLVRLFQRKDDISLVTDDPKVVITGYDVGQKPSQDSMLGIMYYSDSKGTYVDIDIHSFEMIWNLEYHPKLMEFFETHEETENKMDEDTFDDEGEERRRERVSIERALRPMTSSVTIMRRAPGNIMTLNMKLKRSGILIVESIQNKNNNAFIIHMELISKLQVNDTKQTQNVLIQDFHVHSCLFNPLKPKIPLSLVLRPCNVSMIGSVTDQGRSTHFDICFTDVKIGLSAGVIDLLFKIYGTIFGTTRSQDIGEERENNNTNLWKQKEVEDKEFWFLQKGERKDGKFGKRSMQVSAYNVQETLDQICNISLPSIIVTIETIKAKERLPLILAQFQVECKVYDWTTNLFIMCNIFIQMATYNKTLALWEPFLEPTERTVDGKTTQYPWEVKVQIDFKDQIASEGREDASPKEPAVKMDISSRDNLELTVTKSSIAVFPDLYQLFYVIENSPMLPGILAPYLVINMSEIPLTLVLIDGPFQVLDNNDRPGNVEEVTLSSGEQVKLSLQGDVPSMKPDATELSYGIDVEDQSSSGKRFLAMRIATKTCYRAFSVPMFRADRKFYSLKKKDKYDTLWGLVSDVTVYNSGIMLVIKSTVQVFNQFVIPIHMYYQTEITKDMVYVGLVQPQETFNMPLEMVFNCNQELFFSVEGNDISRMSFRWKDLNTTLKKNKILKLVDSASREGPFWINVVGRTQKILFENGRRYTNDSIAVEIYLRAAVVIKNLLAVPILLCVEDIYKQIEPGTCFKVINVEPVMSTMTVKVPNYLNKNWSSDEKIQMDTLNHHVLKLSEINQGENETLTLHVLSKENDGTKWMYIYSQYWMLNKTGLALSCKQFEDERNTCQLHTTGDVPVLFSLTETNNKKNIMLRVADGDWSAKFSSEVVGYTGVVDCRVKSDTYKIGVQICSMESRHTKQVIFTPYYVLVNNAKTGIRCQEADRMQEPWIDVEPESCTGFWPRSANKKKELCVGIQNTTEISMPVSYSIVHTSLVKIENCYGGIYVDVHKMEGAVHVKFLLYKKGLAPALVINHTDQAIQFSEHGELETTTISPREMLEFTWNRPMGSRIITFKMHNRKKLTDKLQRDGFHEIMSSTGKTMYWISFTDGFQRTVLFTMDKNIAQRVHKNVDLDPINRKITLSMRGVGLSLINDTAHKEILYMSISSSKVNWETRKTNKRNFKSLSRRTCKTIEEALDRYEANVSLGRLTRKTIRLDSRFEVNLETKELIHPANRCLRRTFQTALWFEIISTNFYTSMQGKINRLQIDNQMRDCIFPVMLVSAAPSKSIALSTNQKVFIDFSLMQRHLECIPVTYYQYLKILIQEFHIKIDMNFVDAISDLLEWENISEYQAYLQFVDELGRAKDTLVKNVSSVAEAENFFDLLYVSPMKIHMTFSLSKSGTTTVHESPHFFSILLHGLGVTVTEFHDVVLKLHCFERTYTFLTNNQLITEVTTHYTSQILKQTYVLVLGLDLIGNPWGLVTGVGQGVRDLFYEPYLGAAQGPQAFGHGLLIGLRSLLESAVGGTLGAISIMTGAMGTAFAVLTFDSEYQRKRKEITNQMPVGVRQALARSGRLLASDCLGGLTGVVLNPVAGARKAGACGFVKGVGQGVVGLVVRPLVGVFDFASRSTGTLCRAGKKEKEVGRVRLPRFLLKEGSIRPYVRREADGNNILKRIENGRYVSTDTYVNHLTHFNDTGHILLLTDKRILYIKRVNIIGFSVAWDCEWKFLRNTTKVANGIRFTSMQSTQQTLMGRRKSYVIHEYFITIKSPLERQWIENTLRDVIKHDSN